MLRVLRFGGLLAAVVTALVVPASDARAIELTRGPYLQRLTTHSVTVVWNTDTPAACSLAFRPLGGNTSAISSNVGKVCVVEVDGLFPGARYTYSPRADGVALGSEAEFRTDDPVAPFTFLVVGDTGSGTDDEYDVAEQMIESPADLVVHTGDMVYDTGAAADYNPKFFVPFRPLLRRLVLWPCIGEEDTFDDGRKPWLDAFWTPANNASRLEQYYSFDYGNAHFVVLDTTHTVSPGSAMHDFLRQDLATSDATWNFVFFHKPIYSSRVDPPPARRGYLAPVMDDYHVDIAFSGDVHNYERSRPIKGDDIVDEGEGTVYITTGGGGRSTGQVQVGSFTAYTESAFHFTRVAVDGNELRLEMVRQDGDVRDVLTLEKGVPASCGDGRVNHRAEQCDGDDDTACPGACDDDCTCPPSCGDGIVNESHEDCDLADDDACPGRCLPTCECADPLPGVDLEPVADTYIDASDPATVHGAAADLEVDANPERIAYLKFDLRGLSGPVAAASLELYVTAASADGGVVYPVADSSWEEAGLRWSHVDTNGDGVVSGLDRSPWTPSFGRPVAAIGPTDGGEYVTLDVTALFDAGPGLYTLAIRTGSDDKGGFASREEARASRRPLLHVETAASPSCRTASDCDNGVACTAKSCHPISRTCAYTVDHSPCDNGLVCDGAERCEVVAGCVAGTPPPCDDGIACTADACDEATRGCVARPDDGACADGDVCTTDVCDPQTGCRYTDSGLCAPVIFEEVPIGDTTIEAGAEATWDHGASPLLEIDASPERVTYLKFSLDTRALPLRAATLYLHNIDGSPDGGTVYPVPDSTWVEGSGDGVTVGSATGPGLKWVQVDTDGDGRLDPGDASPWLPDFARPLAAIGSVGTTDDVAVDVTEALRGASGTSSLAIRSRDTNKGAYASRESTDPRLRPRLRLVYSCLADGDCDDGAACTEDRCTAAGICMHVPTDALCNDGLSCTRDVCDANTRSCVSEPDHTRCDDGVYCNGAERCAAGAGCMTGAPVGCDDGIACTVDACDETAQICRHVPDDGACDDGDVCTIDVCDRALDCDHATDARCQPVELALEATADTYIEAGAQATWDHGLGAELKVDATPARLIYVKFDVTGLPRPIVAARLRLYATDPGPDGGTVYRVGDSAWVEGDRSGATSDSAGGPGLKWVDVDTNRDGVLDGRDTSPWVPVFAQPLGPLGAVTTGKVATVDVTAAVQGGAGLYTLAVRTPATNGAFYAAREATAASRRPVLELVLAAVPPCTTDAQCDDGIFCTLDRCADGACTHAAADTRCEDGIGCTLDRCVAEVGCVRAADNARCGNGVHCDGVEQCTLGVGCVAGPAVGCDDGIACTVDACDEAADTCRHVPDDGACEDGDVCTTDTCSPGDGCRYGASGLCQAIELALEATADTYIEAGAQATWDHGLGPELKVDATPARLIYIKFDLTGVTRPVVAARLRLYATDPGPDGGTVYRVGDSTWAEGTRTGADSGSAGGPGLKWVDVDTNRDGVLDGRDTSPWVPVFAQPLGPLGAVTTGQVVTVDVTAAVQGGAGLYTLAVRTPATDGTFYAAREAAVASRRPVLELEVAAAPPCTTDAACDDGIACTLDRCADGACTHAAADARCDDGDVCTTDTCSPDAGCTYGASALCQPVKLTLAAVADTSIEAGAQATWDHGLAADLKVDATPARLVYLKFDLTNVTRPVVAARLRLVGTDPGPDGGTVYPVGDSTWMEGNRVGVDSTSAGGPGLKWVDVDRNGDGVLDGRDGSPWTPVFARPLGSLGAVNTGQAVTADVTAAVQGPPGLYTLAVRTPATNGTFYAAREAGVASQRPVLELELEAAPPCATDAECDDGIACTLDRCADAVCTRAADDAHCGDGDVCTTDRCTPGAGCTHRPSGLCEPLELALEATADTYIEAGAQATWDHGAAPELKVDFDPLRVLYLRFDLSGIVGTVTSATLGLRCTNSAPDGGTVYPVADSTWVEGDRTGADGGSAGGPGLRWVDVDTNGDGAVDGRDASAWVPDFSHPIVTLGSVGAGTSVSAEVTAAFQSGPGLYTLALRNDGTNGAFYAAREAASAAQRPVLHLVVSPPSP